ncbi:hypothetical protein C8R45DRAFT_1100423 [Mycena sanguinolenta]|nr:hypothetical protein C8R45DRAFT_1100423 [Mycena sanguinolenta]
MELRAHEQAAENAIPSAHVGQRSRRDAEYAERRARANANSQAAADSVIHISYAHDAARLSHESNAALRTQTRNAAPRRTRAPQSLRNDRTSQHSSSRIRNGRTVSLARAVAPPDGTLGVLRATVPDFLPLHLVGESPPRRATPFLHGKTAALCVVLDTVASGNREAVPYTGLVYFSRLKVPAAPFVREPQNYA